MGGLLSRIFLLFYLSTFCLGHQEANWVGYNRETKVEAFVKGVKVLNSGRVDAHGFLRFHQLRGEVFRLEGEKVSLVKTKISEAAIRHGFDASLNIKIVAPLNSSRTKISYVGVQEGYALSGEFDHLYHRYSPAKVKVALALVLGKPSFNGDLSRLQVLRGGKIIVLDVVSNPKLLQQQLKNGDVLHLPKLKQFDGPKLSELSKLEFKVSGVPVKEALKFVALKEIGNHSVKLPSAGKWMRVSGRTKEELAAAIEWFYKKEEIFSRIRVEVLVVPTIE